MLLSPSARGRKRAWLGFYFHDISFLCRKSTAQKLSLPTLLHAQALSIAAPATAQARSPAENSTIKQTKCILESYKHLQPGWWMTIFSAKPLSFSESWFVPGVFISSLCARIINFLNRSVLRSSILRCLSKRERSISFSQCSPIQTKTLLAYPTTISPPQSGLHTARMTSHLLFVFLAAVLCCRINKNKTLTYDTPYEPWYVINQTAPCLPQCLVIRQWLGCSKKWTVSHGHPSPWSQGNWNSPLMSTAIVANRRGKRSFLPATPFNANLQNLFHKAVLPQRWGKTAYYYLFTYLRVLVFRA